MWTSLIVAAIALAAAAFMLRFLIALLFEGRPSRCYLISLSQWEHGAAKRGSALKRIYHVASVKSLDEKYRAMEGNAGAGDELLDKANYVKQEFSSSPVLFDVGSISGDWSRRPVFQRRSSEHEL